MVGYRKVYHSSSFMVEHYEHPQQTEGHGRYSEEVHANQGVLMIAQKGCISERLLRSRDAHEFISCSEWESEADIEMYAHSSAHEEIVRHTRGLKGAKAEVRLYETVN